MDPESFAGRIWLLVIDKLFIGALIGVVFFIFYVWSSAREQELEDLRHQQQIDLEKARLASEILPVVVDTKLEGEHRANLLSVLTESNAINSGTTARLGAILLDSDVSELAFAQAMRPALLEDAEPFICEASQIVKNWKRGNLTGVKCDGRSWGDDRPVETEQARVAMAHWRAAFEVLVEQQTGPTVGSLNSVEFLGKHLYVLANMIHAGSSDRANTFTNARTLGVQTLGNLTQVSFDPKNKSSLDFITRELTDRNWSDPIEIEFAHQLIHVLRDTREIFAVSLRGEIAMPLARILVTDRESTDPYLKSDHFSLRWQAGEALWRMSDCSVEAQDILASHVSGFMASLSSLNNASALELYSADQESGKLVRRSVDLLGTMADVSSRDVLKSVAEMTNEQASHFPFLRESARRYLH